MPTCCIGKLRQPGYKQTGSTESALSSHYGGENAVLTVIELCEGRASGCIGAAHQRLLERQAPPVGRGMAKRSRIVL